MTDYEVKEVPLTDIFSDEEFNCRGSITLLDVSDLAKDIERNGLQFPITVQPVTDSDSYDYRIIAGHRRYAAFRILKRETIPVMVRSGLSELQARLLNLTENLKRKDLNILQEAKAVKRLRELGLTQEAIAAELTMSRTWVRVRLCLLDLPEAIQEEAAAGILNQYQIQQLYAMDTSEQQYEAVKKIKNAKLNGEKGLDVGKKAVEKPFTKKRQSKAAVQDMIAHIGNTIGFGLATRALAWANGEINSAELYFDIRREALDLGIDYEIPFLQKAEN